jgi:hypothetical protein
MRLGASLTPLSLASRVDNERGENTGGREATPGTGASWWRSRYSVEPMPALMRIARGPLSDGACLRELIKLDAELSLQMHAAGQKGIQKTEGS